MSQTSTTSSSSPPHASGYRIKFSRKNFIEMVEIANPSQIYKVKNFYYFAYDGFVMYTDKCGDNELVHRKIIKAIEFSNVAWVKK